MVPFFQFFSAAWLLLAVCCCAALGYRNVSRGGVGGLRRKPVTMMQSECMFHEPRNGRCEEMVAVLAALQESQRNVSILRPPQGRQVAVLERRFMTTEDRAVGQQPMRMRTPCKNAACVECLSGNTGIFDDFQEKGAARVECLAENTRDFDVFHEKGATRVECLVKSFSGHPFGCCFKSGHFLASHSGFRIYSGFSAGCHKAALKFPATHRSADAARGCDAVGPARGSSAHKVFC
jgi:hypothetical protein